MKTHQQQLASEVDAELRRLGYQIFDHKQISTKEYIFQFSLDDERGWLFLMLDRQTVSWLPTRELEGKSTNWLYAHEDELPTLLKQLRAMRSNA